MGDTISEVKTDDLSNEEKNLTKNNIYYLIYNVLNVLFPFATGIYVARVLLQYDVGLVASAQNLAQYFVILAFLGIPTYGLREIAKYKNDKVERSKVYSELVSINFISTIIFLSIYLVIIFSVPIYNEHLPLYLITGISIALNMFNISFLYEGMNDFKFISIRNIIFKALSFILLIVLVRKSDDYMWYASITVIGTAGNYLINVLSTKKYVNLTFKNLNFKRHIKPIIFLTCVNLAIEIYSLVDITMLNVMCDPETVSIYSYGSKIQKILIQVINTFTITIVPTITSYYKNEKYNLFNNLLSQTLLMIIMLAVPIIIGVFFTSDFLITLIYGESYLGSANVLKVLVFIILISPIGYLLGSRTLLVCNKEKLMLIPVFAGAITNLIGNFILIPIYAEIGASIASVIGELVVMSIYVILGKKHFRLNNILSSILKMMGANIIMFILLFGIQYINLQEYIKIIIMLISAPISYFLVLILLKEKIIMTYIDKLKRRLSWKN